MSTPAHAELGLRAVFEASVLSRDQLWVLYVGVVGIADADELVHRSELDEAQGQGLDAHEHNVIAQTLNKHVADHDLDHPVGYRDPPQPTTEAGGMEGTVLTRVGSTQRDATQRAAGSKRSRLAGCALDPEDGSVPSIPSDPGQLATDFVALNDHLRRGGSRDDALCLLTRMAVRTVPGCDSAAVTLRAPRRPPRSIAVSDETAATADRLQYEAGDGPCLSAAAAAPVVRACDLDTEDRWPEFTAAVRAQLPVRAVLSLHLLDDPHPTALNLYANVRNSFGPDALSVAELFAAHARVLLLHLDTANTNTQLEVALGTSRQIGAAVGILMNMHKVTAQQAFDLLRTHSQHVNRKVREIAEDVTETGSLPEGRA